MAKNNNDIPEGAFNPESPSSAQADQEMNTPFGNQATPVPETAERLSEVELLRKQIADLTAMVRSVADKGRLESFDSKTPTEVGKVVSVSLYNDKAVIAWGKMVSNVVHKVQNSPHSYLQTTELTFLDGSKEVVDYQVWQRDRLSVKAIVESEHTKPRSSEVVFTVSTKDYGTFDIDSKFIN